MDNGKSVFILRVLIETALGVVRANVSCTGWNIKQEAFNFDGNEMYSIFFITSDIHVAKFVKVRYLNTSFAY